MSYRDISEKFGSLLLTDHEVYNQYLMYGSEQITYEQFLEGIVLHFIDQRTNEEQVNYEAISPPSVGRC